MRNGERLPELEVLRDRLAVARTTPPRRRLLPRAGLVVALGLGLAVPAVATRSFWAPLIDGQTPLPHQAPAQTVLAGGADGGGRWRLVAYPAELRDGGHGTCLFLTAGGQGAGACAPPSPRPVLATHVSGLTVFAVVRVDRPATAVRVRWSDGRTQRTALRSARLRSGGAVRFAVLRRRGHAVAGAPAVRMVEVAP